MRSPARSALVLRVVAAAALGVSAYVHVVLAQGPLFSDGQLTLAALFLGQAAASSLAALAVLVLGNRLTWLLVAAVGLASLVALVLSVYVQIPAFGPFPSLYEPFWYADKVVAAGAAGVASAVAVGVLARR